MSYRTHMEHEAERDLGQLLVEASTDLVLVLGELRTLTILPLCPDLARDAEARVSNVLDILADARRLTRERDR